MKRLYAKLGKSPAREDRVRITSRFSATQVYVARLVKSSDRWSKRRYLVDRASIREEEPAPASTPRAQ